MDFGKAGNLFNVSPPAEVLIASMKLTGTLGANKGKVPLWTAILEEKC